MNDPRDRWHKILRETSGDVTLDEYIDDAFKSIDEDAAWGRAGSRTSMSKTGTGGDPLTSRHANAYDDIADEEKTVGECDELGEDDDPIKEAMAATFGKQLNEDEAAKKRRISAIRNIRGQLENVWQMLGKAETKLGIAKFDADEMDFSSIEQTLVVLTQNIKEIMTRIEKARERVSIG